MDIVDQLKRMNAKMEFNQKNQQSLLEMVAEFLNYGLSMYAIFNELLVDIYPKGGMKYIISDISRSIEQGKELSDALSPWYGSRIASIVRSGEISNNLYDSFKIATVSLDKSGNYSAIFMKQISYSLITYLGSCGILALFGLKVMPAILPFIKGKVLPGALANYISYYSFMLSSKFLISLGVLVIFGVLFTIFLFNYVGQYRSKLDNLPIFFLYRKVNAANLLEQLGFYFRAHILLDKAMENIMQSSSTRYLRMHCQNILARVEQGIDNVSQAFDVGLFEKSVTNVLLAMGKVNRFEEKCADYAIVLRESAIETIQKTSKVVGILLMVLTACNVGWSIYAMYGALTIIQQSTS